MNKAKANLKAKPDPKKPEVRAKEAQPPPKEEPAKKAADTKDAKGAKVF